MELGKEKNEWGGGVRDVGRLRKRTSKWGCETRDSI